MSATTAISESRRPPAATRRKNLSTNNSLGRLAFSRSICPSLLCKRLQRACPALLQLPLAQRRHEYYWSADETEWATDVMFRSPEALQRLSPSLLRHAMLAFSSRDVMRFLGHTRMPGAPSGSGGVDVRFNGEVVSDLRERPEGTRIRHAANRAKSAACCDCFPNTP
jgi:hypothetical protein